MEPQFKTSFIPKKSLTQNAISGSTHTRMGAPRGVLFIVSFVIFLVTVVGAGGIFFYTKFLESSIVTKQDTLVRARAAFEPDTIKTLARLDARIEAAKVILDSHIAPSSLFALLEQTTLQSVRFSKFIYNLEGGGIASLELTGEAKDFSGLALQSDVLGSNTVLQNMVVDKFEYNENGSVTFHVLTQADSSFIKFHSAANTSSNDEVKGILSTPELEIPQEGSAVENNSVESAPAVAVPSSTSTKAAPSSPKTSSGTGKSTPVAPAPAQKTTTSNSSELAPPPPPPMP